MTRTEMVSTHGHASAKLGFEPAGESTEREKDGGANAVVGVRARDALQLTQ